MGGTKNNINAVKIGSRLDLRRRRIDGRTNLGKWLKNVKERLIADLGGDITTGQELLIDRIKFKTASILFLEQAFARGESTDYQHYINFSNSLRYDLIALGLKREEKEFIPTIKDYVKEQEGKK